MTDTIGGLDRRTVRAAGTISVFAVLATATIIEPWLTKQGFGGLSIALYTVFAVVLAVSLFADIQRWRNQ